MFQIRKQFPFEASHVLNGLAPLPAEICKDPEHPCGRVHGHSYLLECVFESEKVGDDGFMIDYHFLDPIKKFVNERLDHRHLNEVEEFKALDNPSAELMCWALFLKFKPMFPLLVEVRLSETQKTWASYRE